MCASLSTRLVGIHGGVNATANICDPAGAILHQTPIRTNGAGGSIPGWVFNLGTDNRRRGDAELKVLRDVEDWIANGAAPAFYVYIYSTHGPCVLCRRSINVFRRYAPHGTAGLQGVSVFYVTAGANVFSGQNGYDDVERNPNQTFLKVVELAE